MKKTIILTLAFACLVSAARAAEPILLDWGRLDTAAADRQLQSRALRAAPAAVQRKTPSGTAPWLVQFGDVIREEWKTALVEAGAVLHSYIPENAFLVEATPEVIAAIGDMKNVHWVGEYLPDYKRARAVRAALARAMKGTKDVNVLLFHPSDAERVGQDIAALPGCYVLLTEPMTDRGLVRAALTASAMEEVAGWGEVEWIEPYTPKKLCNDVAQSASKMNVSNTWSVLGLSGAGQTIAVCDTGLCLGNTNTIHRDFTGRVVWAQALGRAGNWSDTDGHGTHVAGSVLGSGAASSGRYRGGSYAANLVFQSVLDSGGGLGGLPLDLNELFRAAFTNGARIHSNSWGSDDAGSYTTDSRYTDMWVWSNKNMLVVFAAGNAGIDANSDGVVDLDSMNAPGTAKNCLTIGASENYRTTGGYSAYQYGVDLWPSDYPANPIRTDYPSSPDSPQGMVAFSSRGPCDDGRIKPDLVAPGSDIISTRSKATSDTGWGTVSGNTNYIYMGGTSMATPLTAGAAGLVRQWLVGTAGITNPSAALIKALMISGARNMAPGQYGTGATQEIPTNSPNNVQGWGHVNLGNTLIVPSGYFLSLYDTNTLATGASNTFTLTVGSTTTNRFRIVMAYSDYWAASGSGKKLVNDLDLTVRKPGGTFLYANGRSSVDATNNVEMIEFAPDETGDYSIRVSGRNVPSGGSQPYALIVRGFLTPASGTPVLTTLAISNRTPTSAMSGGAISSDGGSSVTLRGVCWSTATAPTTNDTRTNNGSGTNSYSSSLTGLTPGQTYYVRAYAVNATGVGYGNEVSFSADCFTNAPGGLTTGAVAETSFTASWSAVGGATGYRLDVSTNNTFTGGGSGSGGSQTFSSLGGGSSSSYLTRIWTNNGVVWTAYKARTDQSVDGSEAICLRNEADAWFTSGTITGGVDEISIVCTQVFTGSGGTFDIFVNSTKVASAIPITTSIVTTKVTGIGVSGSFTIMVTNSGAVRPVFDNLSWTNAASGGAAFVPGYDNRAVAGTSQAVTGLTGGVTYHFRVRAEGAGGCVSGNSTTQSVTTTGGLPAWYTDWATGQGFNPYGPNGGMDDDYDGDGAPNVDEYTAGSNATDDQDAGFFIEDREHQSASKVSLTVDAITGRIYSAYFKTNLTDGTPWSLFKAWTNLSAGEQDLILTNSALIQLYRLGVRVP